MRASGPQKKEIFIYKESSIMLRSSIICYIIRGRRPLMKGPIELIITAIAGRRARYSAAQNPLHRSNRRGFAPSIEQ